jgi:hypothetical protein
MAQLAISVIATDSAGDSSAAATERFTLSR